MPVFDFWPLTDAIKYCLWSVGIGPACYEGLNLNEGIEDLGILLPPGDLSAPAWKPAGTVMDIMRSFGMVGLGARLWTSNGYVTWSCPYCGCKRSSVIADDQGNPNPHFWLNHVKWAYKSYGCRVWDLAQADAVEWTDPGNGLIYGIHLVAYLGQTSAPADVQNGTETLKGTLLGPISIPELMGHDELFNLVKVYGGKAHIGESGQRETREYTEVFPNWDALTNPANPDHIGYEKVFDIEHQAWLTSPLWMLALGLLVYYQKCFTWPRIKIEVPFWANAALGKVFYLSCDDDLDMNGSIWRVTSFRHGINASGKSVRDMMTEVEGVKIN